MGYDRPLALEFKKTEIPATRFVINYLKKVMLLDLSPIQCEVFIVLKDHDDSMSQRELEDCLDLSKSTLSGVLKTMEKNGYINKETSCKDKRVMIVTLSDKGKRIYSETMKEFLRLDEIIFKNVKEIELDILYSVLSKIKTNILSENII